MIAYEYIAQGVFGAMAGYFCHEKAWGLAIVAFVVSVCCGWAAAH